MNRRAFLLSLAAAAASCAKQDGQQTPPGALLGPDARRGHRLRGGDFPPITETRKLAVAIIGGGISGLSAAWKLDKAGLSDFRLFELEDHTGGNARSGGNAISAYPWGAHYLPLPGPEAHAVRELLADFGILHGDPHAANPRYDERALCFAPQERLYRNGLWQEGLVPHLGVSRREHDHLRRFFGLVADFRQRRDALGRRAFALPMALSSADPGLLALDRLSFRDWLLAQGLDSAALHWYANYACRDDYGTDYAAASAWAGLHYFAARDGEAEDAERGDVLTWPEGNGRLAAHFRQRLAPYLQTAAVVHRIETHGGQGADIDVWLAQENRSVRYQADAAIFAAPMHLLPYLWRNIPAELAQAARAVEYAPWLTANLSLDGPPQQRHGAAPAWDNVLQDSPALGYVEATHQQMRYAAGPSVLTFYHAFSAATPTQARSRLLTTPREAWAEWILNDLGRVLPDLRARAVSLDVFRWPHAMARPAVGSLFGAARMRLVQGQAPLWLAHSDLSGFSLFEEANYRGVAAAEAV
ncbi:MAG: FAD-dependent oxidoreductase, partial [Candidatus Methylumidiphilus sp.]